ncbi:MAG: aldo/keto reductase, partial [Terriglobia bacterium]
DAPPEIIEKVRRVEEVCNRHQVPMKAAAIQFPLAHPAVASVIPGARSIEELAENFRLISHPIPIDFWTDMRKAGLIPEEAPTPKAAAAR